MRKTLQIHSKQNRKSNKNKRLYYIKNGQKYFTLKTTFTFNTQLCIKRYIITWILHKIFMYSNKIILSACLNNDPPILILYLIPSPPTG